MRAQVRKDPSGTKIERMRRSRHCLTRVVYVRLHGHFDDGVGTGAGRGERAVIRAFLALRFGWLLVCLGLGNIAVYLKLLSLRSLLEDRSLDWSWQQATHCARCAPGSCVMLAPGRAGRATGVRRSLDPGGRRASLTT